MTLDIIIPHYAEDERTIARLLLSIARQRHIDPTRVRVTIINDSSNVEISDVFLAKFPLKIDKMRTKTNVGCGLARQAAFDATNADYVMFCDADDEFCSADALRMILDRTALLPDVVQSDYFAERDDGKCGLVGRECTMVHGKAFRRRFLVDEGIRFRADLRTNEDVYFVGLACAVADSVEWIQYPLYVYKYNASSISRANNGAYHFDEYVACMRASMLLITELKARGKDITRIKASLLRSAAHIRACAPADKRAGMQAATKELINA